MKSNPLNRFVWPWLEVLILAMTLSFLGAAFVQAADPLPVVHFTTAPYDHNMENTYPTAYSGRWIVHGHQWGVYVLNADTQEFHMISGVGKSDQLSQPPHIVITGDCWQTYTRLSASPTTPKWVVWIGANPMCNGQGTPQPQQAVQVARLDSPGYRWIGQVAAPLVDRVAGMTFLDGDFFYAPEGLYPATVWSKIDLNAMAVVSHGAPPTNTAQPDIGGFTYALSGDGALLHFKFTRGASGAPTPTPAPQPTPTPGPPAGNPFAQQIEALKAAGITAGCGPDLFCPTREMTRQEVAAWLAIALKLPLLPCMGVFLDVPCPMPGFRALQP